MLAGKTIVVGVTGGIAAYKACDLVSKLTQRDAQVHVIMTRNATEFVGPMTFQTLSGRKVVVDLFDEISEFDVHHVSVSDAADCFVIAPATANIIGKIANGIADDALSTTVMAAGCPVLLAPAMNTRMWENPVTQDNLDRLRELGYRIIPPEPGWLACGYEGVGRLAAVSEIISFVETAASGRTLDLAGLKVLITAGPTQEAIDPVRFVSNPSTGKMGYALARAAVARGAEVTLVSGPTSLDDPLGVRCVHVTSAQEMYEAVMAVA
ncbi:MAG: bifunctional phosphopantothenoylcysteine decarboxylase/phosphopantothenate--cysteine ligase CoaBC, partial [Armatimonadota bacterium]